MSTPVPENPDSESVEATVLEIAQRARAASLQLGTLPQAAKNAALEALASRLEQSVERIQEANQKDLEAGREQGLSAALLDRLELTQDRIRKMADGVRQVAALPDPVGEEIERLNPPSGLDIRKVRVPIGVVGIIYESRPNVTVDCAVLCLKSGNAAILRGGSEAFHSNTLLAELICESLIEAGIDPATVQLIPTTDRAAMNVLLKLDEYVHCIIPRGGEGLIRFVAEHARMPVIKHYLGVCSAYVDASADADLAEKLVLNAKLQRPGVCNAIENLFIHQDRAEDLLPRIAAALAEGGVELRVDSASREALEHSGSGLRVKAAEEADFGTEYLDKIIAIKLVDSLQSGINAINQYGSAHSDLIVAEDEAAADRFLNGVDSATVYWNASTRFTDGFEFGLGAEIGISTDRLHARGPMGLRELCTYKFKIYGKGEIRS